MPTTPIDIVLDRKAVLYTGTNSAEIDALITDFTITSEDATTLFFTSQANAYHVHIGGYVTYWNDAVHEDPFANADELHNTYREEVSVDHVHELKLRTCAGSAPTEGDC